MSVGWEKIRAMTSVKVKFGLISRAILQPNTSEGFV